jgi:zinc protease
MADLTPDDCRALYDSSFGGELGEFVLIGPDLEGVDGARLDWIQDWPAASPPERIVEVAQLNDGDAVEIQIADKTNIGYSAGMNLALRDDHQDYPALVLANYLFGGATLVSRLSTEVRGKRGLSYSIYSSLNAHPIDQRGRFSIAATTNPENRAELLEAVTEQLRLWVEDGLTKDEVEQGKASLLASRFVARAKDRNVASLIATQEFAGRTLEFLAELDEQIESLTAESVNEAVRRWVDPQRMIHVQAGDLG